MTDTAVNDTRNAARFAGILFLLQMTAAVISHSVILMPMLRGEHFLIDVAAHHTKVVIAMLLDLVTGAAVFGIAVILFPILKKHSERIALWYVGLRLTEWIIALIGGMFLLTVLSIGKDYVQPDVQDPSSLQMLAGQLLHARGSIRNLMLLCFCLSASMFYILLFQSRLLPRFISIWGLLGVALLGAQILSSIFGSSLGGIVMMVPMGMNEIFLGVWLIVKGFNPSVTNSG